MTECPFCAIIAGDTPATIVEQWDDAVAIVPLSPVRPGRHLLVIPREHVPDAVADPDVAAVVMRRCAEPASGRGDVNIIFNVGAAATQTVGHLHGHVVIRRAGDGLALPWPTNNTPTLRDLVRAARAAGAPLRRYRGDGGRIMTVWQCWDDGAHRRRVLVRRWPDNRTWRVEIYGRYDTVATNVDNVIRVDLVNPTIAQLATAAALCGWVVR